MSGKIRTTPHYHWWRGFVAGVVAMGWVCVIAKVAIERLIP